MTDSVIVTGEKEAETSVIMTGEKEADPDAGVLCVLFVC